MKRRDFITRNAWILGGAILIGGTGLFTVACQNTGTSGQGDGMTKIDADFLNQLADYIIPETDTPGAKATDPGSYIVLIHNDCLELEEQKENMEHLLRLKKNFKGISLDSNDSSIAKIIEQLDQDKDESFLKYKKLIISAYLSSEIGTSVFMKYKFVPGVYEGCTSERPW